MLRCAADSEGDIQIGATLVPVWPTRSACGRQLPSPPVNNPLRHEDVREFFQHERLGPVHSGREITTSAVRHRFRGPRSLDDRYPEIGVGHQNVERFDPCVAGARIPRMRAPERLPAERRR